MAFDSAGADSAGMSSIIMAPSAGTVGGWVNLNNLPTASSGNRMILFSIWDRASDFSHSHQWGIGLRDNFSATVPHFFIIDSGGSSTLDHTTTLSTSTLYHIVGSWSGISGTVTHKIYVNGSVVSDTGATGRDPANDDGDVAPRTTVSGVDSFGSVAEEADGCVSEMACFSSQLSDAAVANWYNSGSGERADDAGVGSPVEYYRISPVTPLDTPEVGEISTPGNDLTHDGTPSFCTHPFDSSGGGGPSLLPRLTLLGAG